MTFRVFDGMCKAGGAGAGYARAGAEVVGWDVDPQPNNPHEFHQGDVFSLELAYLRTFDLLHFSPNCQGYTELRSAPGAKGSTRWPLMIPQCRELAKAAGVPYVIENVRAAAWDMVNPVKLSGDMFGLVAHGGYLLRERLFECSFPVGRPTRRRRQLGGLPVIGVYGGHCRIRSALHGGRGTRDPWSVPHRQVASDLMGIDWMTMDELDQAIPPAYTEHIAKEFLRWRDSLGHLSWPAPVEHAPGSIDDSRFHDL